MYKQQRKCMWSEFSLGWDLRHDQPLQHLTLRFFAGCFWHSPSDHWRSQSPSVFLLDIGWRTPSWATPNHPSCPGERWSNDPGTPPRSTWVIPFLAPELGSKIHKHWPQPKPWAMIYFDHHGPPSCISQHIPTMSKSEHPQSQTPNEASGEPSTTQKHRGAATHATSRAATALSSPTPHRIHRWYASRIAASETVETGRGNGHEALS